MAHPQTHVGYDPGATSSPGFDAFASATSPGAGYATEDRLSPGGDRQGQSGTTGWAEVKLDLRYSRFRSVEVEQAFMVDLFSRGRMTQLIIMFITLCFDVYCIGQFNARGASNSTTSVTTSALFGVAIAVAASAILFLITGAWLIDIVVKDVVIEDEAGSRSVGEEYTTLAVAPTIGTPEAGRLVPSKLAVAAQALQERQRRWPQVTKWTHWWLTNAWEYHMVAAVTMLAVAYNGTFMAICVPDSNIASFNICATYRNGGWPLIPMLVVVAATVAPLAVISNFIAGLAGWLVSYVVLIVQMSIFYAGTLGEEGRVWNSVNVALLLAICAACTVNVLYSISSARRKSFSLILTLRKRFGAFKAAVQARAALVERMQAAKNAQLRAEASRAVAEVTIGYVAHQLRNPLHAMSSLIDDFEQREVETARAGGWTRDRGRENVSDLEDMRAAVSHMTRITDDAMTHQQLLMAKVQLKLERVRVRRLLTKMASHIARRLSGSVSITISDTVPECVMFDALHVNQAITNGLANAFAAAATVGGWVEMLMYMVKAIPPEIQPGSNTSPQIVDTPGNPLHDLDVLASAISKDASGAETAQASPSLHAPFLHIEVINAGPGVGTLTKKHLFMPFIAGTPLEESVTPTRIRSIGLGLSIVRLLAEVMKARVGLYDEPNPAVSINSAARCLTHFFLEIPLILPREADVVGAEVTTPSQWAATETVPRVLLDVSGTGQRVSSHVASLSLTSADVLLPEDVHLHVNMPDSAGRTSTTWLAPPAAAQFGFHAADEKAPMNPPPARHAQGPSQAAGPQPTPGTPRYAGLRVLTADDEVSNRKINARLLHRLGAESVVVSDGDEVVPAWRAAMAEQRPFDVVLLDIIMNRMSGIQALQKLKEAGYTGAVIAATGNATPMDQACYLAAGFDAVLAKPFNAGDIANMFASLGIMPPSPARPEGHGRGE